ncbi:MAG: TfoX/Sxy family protein [Rhizobiaceae bacterium]
MTDMLPRLHARLDPLGARPVKMFGGTCFMLNGNMLAGTSKRGLLVRVGKDFDATAAPPSTAMEMGGKPMAGYRYVDENADDGAFVFWMDAAIAFNRTLPPK